MTWLREKLGIPYNLLYILAGKVNKQDLVECEICGCLIYKSYAADASVPELVEIPCGPLNLYRTHSIKYKYYCKLHRPVKDKEEQCKN